MNLPPEWEIRECKDYPGRVFYYNKVTSESTWIRPLPYIFGPGNTNWPPTFFAAHILVKHKDLRNNARTWKPDPVTRTREEAKELIFKLFGEMKTGERTFEQIAETESDCIDSHAKEGDLGWIRRHQMPQRFEEVVLKLAVGDVSEPVETELGWHIIKRKG